MPLLVLVALRSPSLTLSRSSPAAVRDLRRDRRPRAWAATAKSLSCTSQKPLSPFSARASIATSAAGSARGWKGSGSFFQTRRDLVAVLVVDLLERRLDAPAERALEVGELDDCDQRVRAPLLRRRADGDLEHRRRVVLLALSFSAAAPERSSCSPSTSPRRPCPSASRSRSSPAPSGAPGR